MKQEHNRQLTLFAHGGLGNRMRAIASAVSFSKYYNYKLKIIWLNDKEVACDINFLFKGIGLNYIETGSKLEYNFYKYFYRHKLIQAFQPLYQFIGKLFFDKVIFDKDILNGWKPNQKIIDAKESIFIRSCRPFFEFKDFNDFSLNDHIKSELKKKISSISPSYAAVHIRGLDNKKTLENSPISKYIDIIQNLLNEDSALTFFVASDEKEFKDILTKQFGSNIVTFPSVLVRNTREGIEDALIELYCLANAHTIICSPYSSFSDTAQLIGSKKKVILAV